MVREGPQRGACSLKSNQSCAEPGRRELQATGEQMQRPCARIKHGVRSERPVWLEQGRPGGPRGDEMGEVGAGLAGHCKMWIQSCGPELPVQALRLMADLGLETHLSFFRTTARSSTTPLGLLHIPVLPQLTLQVPGEPEHVRVQPSCDSILPSLALISHKLTRDQPSFSHTHR